MTRNPVRFFGHPLHPPTTHLPVGLLAGSVVWDVLGLATGTEVWWQVAWWSLLLGLAASLPTALTGLLEFAALPSDDPASSRAVLHMVSALAAVGLFGTSAALRMGVPEPGRATLVVAVSGLGLVGLLVAGWSGGEMVFRHGVGTALHRERSSGKP